MPFQLRAREFFQLAQALRDEGCTAHITAGGHFATFEYENILRDFPAVDSVVRHEGEQTFRELVQRVSRGEPIAGLAGTVTRGLDGIVDAGKRRLPPLDDLAFPDRRGSPYDGHSPKPRACTRRSWSSTMAPTGLPSTPCRSR